MHLSSRHHILWLLLFSAWLSSCSLLRTSEQPQPPLFSATSVPQTQHNLPASPSLAPVSRIPSPAPLPRPVHLAQPTPVLPTLIDAPLLVAYVQRDPLPPRSLSLWAVALDQHSAQPLLATLPDHATATTHLIDWSTSTGWLAAALGESLWIFPRNHTPGFAIPLDSHFGYPTHVTWSPNGTELGILQHTEQPATSALGIVDVSARTVQYLYVHQTAPGSLTQLAWSPNTHYLAFVQNETRVLLLHRASHHAHVIAEACGATIATLAWSPDSRWIAHLSFGNGRYASSTICLSNMDHETIHIRVPDSYTNNFVWEDRGTAITFFADTIPAFANPAATLPPPNPRLLRFELATKQLHQLASLQHGTRNTPFPALLRDPRGTGYAYLSNESELRLTLLNQDGTRHSEVSWQNELPNTRSYPYLRYQWASDGQSLIVARIDHQQSWNLMRYGLESRRMHPIIRVPNVIEWALAP